MNILEKNQRTARRTHRIRAKIHGTAERPRLCVNVSNRHISAQLIDDTTGKTVASASTIAKKAKGTMLEQAKTIGDNIAAEAKKAKVTKAVLDRGPKRYHGRVKVLVETAREKGLEV